ncbi:chain length determinant protein EpsF [uncultured Aquabacterium sp.]|uniref:chain length determinant protein EpsF n=1 Tax=uncultured Aquabacterium sp. TaxID=158753 RepID=UPI0025DE44E6|nr:chain length determinant protein EpsF [uncultured Aquabacterium sp.]
MTFKQLVLVLKARWLLSVSILVAVLIAAGLTVLLLPSQYTATATVLVDGRNNGAFDPINGNVVPLTGSSSVILTQADIVRSERVVKRAMRAIRITENRQVRAQWNDATGGKGDFEAWLAQLIQSRLDVKPSKDSNIISVSYTATEPAFAALVTNAIVKAYMDVTLELRVEPAKQYTNFFDDRARQARDALEKARAKLSTYQQQSGITSTDERLDVENARLNELSSQVVSLQAIVSESVSRKAAAEQRGDRTTEALSNPVLVGLTTDLARQEAKLQEMDARFGDRHPSVVELRANIQELRRRIDSETRRVTSSVGVTTDINQARLAQVRAELDAQRAKVLRLKAGRDDMAVLEREVEHAQRNYDLVMARVSQTSLESQNNQTNVSMLRDASAPAFPSSPNVKLTLAVALVLGTLLAIATSLLLELVTPRLRGEQEVASKLGLPVLAVLPDASAKPGSLRTGRIVEQVSVSRNRLLAR